MKKKTVKEVVLETIEYYENNPERRAVSSLGACFYYEKDTAKLCAVGRCMKDPTQSYSYGISELRLNDRLIGIADVHKEMKEEYSDIPVTVWEDLQSFHDRLSLWTSEGLSEAGQQRKETLINKYCQN